MTLAEESPEPVELAALERSGGVAHALILRRDVAKARGNACRELPLSLRITRVLERMPVAGVDDEDGEIVRQTHVPVLQRAAVEQEGRALAAEERCSLIHDPAGDADRTQLGSPARERQLDWLQREIRDRAERKADRDLERRRGAQAGARRQIRLYGSCDADRGPPELGQFGCHGRRVPAPTASPACSVGRDFDRVAAGDKGDPLRLLDRHANADVDGDRQHEPARVVRVVPDQIDAARRPEAPSHGILRLVKVTLVGAGSTVFAKTLIGDVLSFPEFRDATVALTDIDAERLLTSEVVARRLADSHGANARVEATADRRAALDGADYVITMFQVGGYRPATVTDFEVPKRFGLRQTIGDTLGIGGIMRGLRTVPVLLEMCRDMEELCPDALMLQYVNPMAILFWAVARASSVRCIGLCHSVQGTAGELAADLGVPRHELEYVCAGINHLAFYLELRHGGRDLYPDLRGVLAEGRVPEWNRVRYEVFRRFGYFSTESSEHLAEYVPWFIKASRPELVGKFNIPLDEYPRRCEQQIAEWEELRTSLDDGARVTATRSDEYGARIMHALETGEPFPFNGNVVNDGPLIDNLPAECCVEVPCVADERGITPERIGILPPQLAALIQTNVNVQALTVEAALTGRRDHVDHAAMVDPHTGAELALEEIHDLVDDLLEAHGDLVPPLR